MNLWKTNLKSLCSPITKWWKMTKGAEFEEVTQGHRQHSRSSAYDFLFDFNINYVFILYHFLVTASYFLKIAYFNLPHLHLSSPLGWAPFEFGWDLWHQKPRVPVHCLHNPTFSLFNPIPECDRQTDIWRQHILRYVWHCALVKIHKLAIKQQILM